MIVADGFYEWKKEGSTKRPHRITLKNKELFGFAGLWDTWKSPTGEIVNSCSIITTTPNELMEPIHNRMPVILSRDVEPVWLDQGIVDNTFLKSLLTPYSADLMIAYEVSAFVNSVKNNGPECMVGVGGGCFKVMSTKFALREPTKKIRCIKPNRYRRFGLFVSLWIIFAILGGYERKRWNVREELSLGSRALLT